MWVSFAVINFNDGNCGILNVFKNAKMETRYFTNMFYLKNKLLANDEKKNKKKLGN